MKAVNYDNNKIQPSKIICIGRNYVEHIEELNNETPDSMVVFNKPNSAIRNQLNYFSEDTRFEGEICFLMIDKKIDAVAFGLDLTKADIQNKMKQKGLPWERSKSFDGSAVFGDFVKFEDNISTLRLELFINGILVQFANFDLMIYKPLDMIKEIESFMSIEDGDIIMSGTPKGVGTYKVGDVFIGKIFSSDKLMVESKWEVVQEYV
ncbi:MAG: 2-keto-4-pentenoate hydratase/2-oxohepta-3-ene-1,7-dioic acid hydratase in catechol pathway [Sulfurimonas sp.]|jgi:2-keto-4-pentenoate hydratase/2-oxohepta-3-ene-1,7-dioic acid hydratase in catechol pathway